jgi:hypothetical protein
MKIYTGCYLSFLLPVRHGISNVFWEMLSPLCAEALFYSTSILFLLSQFLEGYHFREFQ